MHVVRIITCTDNNVHRVSVCVPLKSMVCFAHKRTRSAFRYNDRNMTKKLGGKGAWVTWGL